MKCFGFPEQNKTCYLCCEVHVGKECMKEESRRKKEWKELQEIKKRCKFVVPLIVNDWQEIDACNKNGKAYDRDTPYCNPKRTCERRKAL